MKFALSIRETNIIKGVAICLMLWHHLFSYSIFISPPEQVAMFGKLVFDSSVVSRVCVAMFVFVSGYGLTKQIEKKVGVKGGFLQNVRFVLRRYVKFYLNYWVVFLLVVPIGILMGRTLVNAYIDNPIESQLWGWYENGFGNSIYKLLVVDFLGMLNSRSYNSNWWFNRMILLLYLVFPLLYQVLKRGKWVSLLMFVVVYYVIGFSPYVLTFVFGIFFSLNDDKIKLNRKQQIMAFVGLFVVLLLIVKCRFYQLHPKIHGVMIDPWLSTVIVAMIAMIQRRIGRIGDIFVFLGKHSMNIYLIHFFICGYFFHDFIYGFKYPVFIFAVLMGCSVVGSLIIQWIKKLIYLQKIENKIIGFM